MQQDDPSSQIGPSSQIEPSSQIGRREMRRRDRREAILAVAGPWFLDHGYAGTTMSAIAAELGGSKGTLWNHFPSKEELFAAVVDQRSAEFRARVSEILEPGGDPAVTLRRFCLGFIAKIASPAAVALQRLVIGEAGRFPEVGRIFYERAPRMTHALVAGYLKDAMERGRLRAADPTKAAEMLVGLAMAGAHHRVLVGVIDRVDDGTIAEDAERAVKLFLSLYGPDHPLLDGRQALPLGE